MLDPATIYILSLIVISLVLLLLGIGAFYLSLVQKNAKLLEENAELKTKLGSEMQRVIQASEAEALKIIHEAKQIASNIQIGKTELEEVLLSKFEEQSRSALTNIQKEVQTYLDHSQKELQKITADVPVKIAETTDIVRSTLQVQFDAKLVDIGKMLDQEVGKLTTTIHADIGAYKKSMIEEIDREGLLVIKNIARRVVQKELTTDEHEKLVMKALEEAKRANFFAEEPDLPSNQQDPKNVDAKKKVV